MKNKRIFIGLMFLMIVIAVFCYACRIYQRRNFCCTSQFYISQKNISMRAIYRMLFSGSEGIISITGEVVDEHKNHLALNRQIVFSFKERDNNYLMLSLKGIKESYDNVENALLKQMINPFFFDDNQSIQYQILPQANGDYVVFSGKLPVAWCHVTN